MHKFLRAAGFSMYTKKKDIEKLLDLLERQPSVTKCVQVDEESNVCEMRTEVAPGLGISIVGELKEEGKFRAGILLSVPGERCRRLHGRVLCPETHGERDIRRHGG